MTIKTRHIKEYVNATTNERQKNSFSLITYHNLKNLNLVIEYNIKNTYYCCNQILSSPGCLSSQFFSIRDAVVQRSTTSYRIGKVFFSPLIGYITHSLTLCPTLLLLSFPFLNSNKSFRVQRILQMTYIIGFLKSLMYSRPLFGQQQLKQT